MSQSSPAKRARPRSPTASPIGFTEEEKEHTIVPAEAAYPMIPSSNKQSAPGQEEEEGEVPGIILDPFAQGATLKTIHEFNESHGLVMEPSSKSQYLRPSHRFSIELTSPSMMAKLLMTAQRVKKTGGCSNSKVALSVVMFRGEPQLAIDVADDTSSFMFSTRIHVTVRLHPDHMPAAGGSKFPILIVDAADLATRLAAVTETHQVLLYQTVSDTSSLQVLMQVPGVPGVIRRESVKLFVDEYESFSFQDCEHTITLQLRAQHILSLCKRNMNNPEGLLSLSVYSQSDATVQSGHFVGDLFLVAEIRDELDQVAQVIFPMTVTAQQEDGAITMHVSEPTITNGFDIESIVTDASNRRFSENFRCNIISAFLSQIDPKKMVVLRMAKEQVLALSYQHGDNVLMQLLVPPFGVVDDEF